MNCVICFDEFPMNGGTICLHCGDRTCRTCYQEIISSGRKMVCQTCGSTKNILLPNFHTTKKNDQVS